MSDHYIGIVSDSHGQLASLKAMVRNAPDVIAWLHCGDIEKDGPALEKLSQKPVIAVRGNNDYGMPKYPMEQRITISGIEIYMIHGHQWYGLQREQELLFRGHQYKADLVLFGHTHVPYKRIDKAVTIVNPGSISRPRDGLNGSYAIATIDKEKLMNITLCRI